MVREVETIGEALYVRVGGDAFPDIKEFAKDNVRGLVADTGEGDELGFRTRHGSAMLFLNFFRRTDNRLRLIRENRGIRFREIFCCFVFFEERSGEPIHRLVGALCRENDGSDKLERHPVIELALRFRIRLLQVCDYFLCTCNTIHISSAVRSSRAKTYWKKMRSSVPAVKRKKSSTTRMPINGTSEMSESTNMPRMPSCQSTTSRLL